MKKQIIALILIAFAAHSCSKNKLEIMAVTGATPKAVDVDVPGGFNLVVDGLVKRTYAFTTEALNAFPSTWFRTREVSPSGEFLGTYAYTGIPLYGIMDGVAPEKPKTAAFDRPLDMLVTFTSSDGKKAVFSYGELAMADDSLPVVLAYNRQEVLPTEGKTVKEYKHNRYKENLKGLRLIATADPDNARYLDNVVKITFSDPAVSATGLPAMKKGAKCSSTGLTGHWKGKAVPVNTAGIARLKIDRWVRTGHGRGYKTTSSAEGVSLRELLKKNFPGCGEKEFYLFIACDGYRAIFSGREIFRHEAGRSIMVIDRIDGKASPNGPMLGPVKDYFVDRDVWGLSHIVVLDNVE